MKNHLGHSAEERFWKYVQKTNSCWLWTGSLSPQGYGQFHLNGGPKLAHRIAYEWMVGPIPNGMDLDHVLANGCTNRNCIKAISDEFGPAHLEAVSRYENIIRGTAPTAINARKTHCIRGHELSGSNLINRTRKTRECKICKQLTRKDKKSNV